MSSIINVKVVFQIISRNLLITSIALFLCIVVACIYKENIYPFVISSIITFFSGLGLYFLTKAKAEEEVITRKTAYFTVSMSWFVMVLFGSLPYILSGSIPNFVNALFESVSGFTTTGASILVDIESLPKSILLWRSLTHWIGGIGIILLVIIVLPSLQIGSYHIFTLESSLQTKIQARIKSIGLRLLFIYIALTLSEVILLVAGKMNLFESVCHAFGTVSTGGFSPKNSSIGGYSSYIQYVIMIFMLLSGTNFVIHYYILKRKFDKIKENEELKLYFIVVLVVGLIISCALFFDMHKPLELALRESFFNVISIITCTGFATADYMQWPVYAWMLIFISMFLGGCTGSTAGGIKIVRHLIFLKNIRNIFRKMLSPNEVIMVYLNRIKLSKESNISILTFISIYLLIFFLGSIILIFLNVDGLTASSSVATCMAGIGPGVGIIGPAGNFADLPTMAKLVLSLLMLIGRLEIYTIVILFSKTFWTK